VTCGRSVVSPGIPVSSNNKTDHHDIAEILLKVALNTITLTRIALRYLDDSYGYCFVCRYGFAMYLKLLTLFSLVFMQQIVKTKQNIYRTWTDFNMYTLSKLSDKYKQKPTTNDLMICGSCKDKNIMFNLFENKWINI
jgi:hypothetical protein